MDAKGTVKRNVLETYTFLDDLETLAARRNEGVSPGLSEAAEKGLGIM